MIVQHIRFDFQPAGSQFLQQLNILGVISPWKIRESYKYDLKHSFFSIVPRKMLSSLTAHEVIIVSSIIFLILVMLISSERTFHLIQTLEVS